MSNRLKLKNSEVISTKFVFLFAYTAVGVMKNLDTKKQLEFNFCFTVLAFIDRRFSKLNKDFIAINRISRTPV